MDEQEHTERLDQMVKEALRVLGHSRSQYVIIDIPWFSAEGNLDSLFDEGPAAKAAVVFLAARELPDELDRVSRTAEALYHSREIRQDITELEEKELQGAWSKYWDLGYKVFQLYDITSNLLGEDADYSRTRALRTRLEEKMSTFDAPVLYWQAGSNFFVHEELRSSIENQLEDFAHEIVPELLEQRGYKKLSDLITEGLGEKYKKRAELLKEAILESTLSEYLEQKDTIDGEDMYVPEYVVSSIEQAISNYVEAIPPNVFQRISRPKVPNFLGPIQSLAGLVSGISLPRLPSRNGEGTPEETVPEQPTAIKPRDSTVPDEHEISGYLTLRDAYDAGDYGTVVNEFVPRRRFGKDRPHGEHLAYSAQIRYSIESITSFREIHGRPKHRRQNRLWTDFKAASQSYQDLNQNAINSSIVRADVEVMEGFLGSPVYLGLEQHFKSQILKEVGRFKETFSLN